MSLSTAEFLLVLLGKWGGNISGRTLLQKRAYFVQQISAQEFVAFRPHFFGPFSPEIDSAIGLLVELGFVKEEEIRFSSDERVRYDYSLTDDGRRLVQSLVDAHADIAVQIQGAVERISQSGNLDYNQLSLAAKIAHIVESESRPMTAGDISSRAAELGWRVNPGVVLPVAGFLQSLDLIYIKGNKNQGVTGGNADPI